jgi:2-dehydropantoate 2-reductase
VNCVTSAIAVLTQETIGGLIDFPSGREWMRLVGEEVASVAQALGIRLPYDNVMDRLLKNSQAAGAAKPSMRQDVEKKRWTEIDFINGAVVREAKRVGVPTPYNLALMLMIRMIDARAHGEEKIFA